MDFIENWVRGNVSRISVKTKIDIDFAIQSDDYHELNDLQYRVDSEIDALLDGI